MPLSRTALPGARRPPAAARARHALPTRHKVPSVKERAPASTSTIGERWKESYRVPDMARGRNNWLTPNTMQQPNPCLHEPVQVLPPYVLLRCGNLWVVGEMGRWIACGACCFCRNTVAAEVPCFLTPNSTTCGKRR